MTNFIIFLKTIFTNDEGTKTPINTIINNPNAPILLCSDTPRNFDLEDEYLNEKMFGKIEYSYGIGGAIEISIYVIMIYTYGCSC